MHILEFMEGKYEIVGLFVCNCNYNIVTGILIGFKARVFSI